MNKSTENVNKKKKSIIYTNRLLPVLAFLIIFVASTQIQKGFADETITVDPSKLNNANDFLSGIVYDGSRFIYATAYNNGEIVKIDKTTKEVTVLNDGNAKAGRVWYSIATNSTNSTKFYINEADTGLFHVFEPDATIKWRLLPIPQDISGGVITYTNSYQTAPNKITVTCAGNTYDFGFSSFGEIQVTNGFIWQIIDYKYDFNSADNTCGANDVEFHGIVKINPKTLTVVSRTAITGAENLRGITTDASDFTVLWITDNTADKIYQFDTDTSTVTKTINLPAGSKARGITCDTTNCYVASNKVGNGVGTGKILKVVKADGTTSELDTGAVIANNKGGIFNVDLVSGILFYSTESGQIGTFTLSNSAKTKTDTTGIDENRFGVVVDGTYWWAGKGSAKVFVTNIPSSGSTDSSSDELTEFMKNPTFGVSHDDRKTQLVDYGFTWNGKQYPITDNWYTPFEKVKVKTAEYNYAKLKIFSFYNLRMAEIALVSDIGKRHEAESAITIYFDHNMNPIDVVVRQDDKIINEKNIGMFYKKVKCTLDEDDKTVLRDGEALCHEISIYNILFREEPQFEKISIMAVDEHGRSITTYLNEGFDVSGVSLNPLKTAMMGLEEMTQIDKFENLWTNKKGDLYTTNNDNSWILLYKVQTPKVCNDSKFQVLERYNCNFSDVVKQEQQKAVAYLKANHPELFIANFAEINDIVLYKERGIDHRTKFLQENDMMWVRDGH